MDMAANEFLKFFGIGRSKGPDSQVASYRSIARPRESGSQTHDLPRFRGSARDLDRGFRDATGKLDPLRSRLRRAFTPSQPVSDVRMFAGRRELLLALIRAIEEEQMHVVIFGDRGIGKTSMLHVLSQLAREARYIVRYYSCSETSDFDTTIRAIAADIPLLYSSDYDPAADDTDNTATLHQIFPEGVASVAQASDVLDKLTGTRVLIILDEFDRATSEEFKRSIAELVKSLSDRMIRVQIVVAGVAANLTELLEYIPSIRRNIVGVAVPVMERDELRELIQLGAQVSELVFVQSAMDEIIGAANGSPYVASLLSQHAAAAALDRDRRQVERSDVTIAVKRAVSEMGVRLSPGSRQQLAGVATRMSADMLLRLADAAIRGFGRIVVAPDDGDRADAARIAVEAGMLVSDSVDSTVSYRFADDSLATFIWLSARSRLTS